MTIRSENAKRTLLVRRAAAGRRAATAAAAAARVRSGFGAARRHGRARAYREVTVCRVRIACLGQRRVTVPCGAMDGCAPPPSPPNIDMLGSEMPAGEMGHFFTGYPL